MDASSPKFLGLRALPHALVHLRRLDLLRPRLAWALGLGVGALAGLAVAGFAPWLLGGITFLGILGAAAVLAWSGEPLAVASASPPPQNPDTPIPLIRPKKTSPWVWVGVGCLVLLLLGAGTLAFIGYKAKKMAEKYKDNPELAAVELAIRTNPDLEEVSSDKDAKTVTVRDKKTGKVMTLNFEDIKNGKFSMEGEDGSKVNIGDGQVQVTDEKGQTTTIVGGVGTSNLPDWLPAYPGATAISSYSATGANGGAVTMFELTDSADQALSFYEEKLKDAGFTVEKNSYKVSGQTAGGTVTAKNGGDKGDVNVLVGAQGGKTSITITHSNK